MLNVIKSDIKRLSKSKGFWISIGVFIVIYAICIIMQVNSQSNGMIDGTNGGNEAGFYISIDIVVKSLNLFATMFGHSFGVLVLGIYLTSFICSEYTSGYVKNIVSLTNGRMAMIVSKIIVAMMLSCVIILICYIQGYLLGSVLIDGFEVEAFAKIIKSVGVMFVMSLSMFSLIIFVSTVFRNKTAGIVLLFLISSGMLYPFIDGTLKIIHLSFLSKYSLSYLFMNLIPTTNSEIIKVVSIFIFYIFIYNILSIGILRKKDL